MDPAILDKLGPIVAVCVTFAFPVLIVFVVQHFKFKNRELQAEIEARRQLGERDKAYLEARIERLEQVVLAQAGRGYARQHEGPVGVPLQAPQAPIPPSPLGPVQPGPILNNPGLFEAPPAPAELTPPQGGKRDPNR